MTTPAKRVFSFHYTLTNTQGEVVDTSRDSKDPFAFIEGSGQIIPGLEKPMLLLSAGDTRKIEVEPKEAYGEHDKELIVEVPKAKLPNPAEVEIGDQFQASGPNGEMLLFRVMEINGDNVKLDGNHPLAGEKLTFDIEVMGIRDATNEEMAHGHVHGAGGHHH